MGRKPGCLAKSITFPRDHSTFVIEISDLGYEDAKFPDAKFPMSSVHQMLLLLSLSPIDALRMPPVNAQRAAEAHGGIKASMEYYTSATLLRRRVPASPRAAIEKNEPAAPNPTGEEAKSLEEKMASWDASEEEKRAKTLGGNIPLIGMPGKPGRETRTDQPKGLDGFDVGMNISALILFPLAIILFSVPLWIGSIDVSSVGAPPMT